MADAGVRVALLARAGKARDQLHRALGEAGALIVAEGDPSELDPGRSRRAVAQRLPGQPRAGDRGGAGSFRRTAGGRRRRGHVRRRRGHCTARRLGPESLGATPGQQVARQRGHCLRRRTARPTGTTPTLRWIPARRRRRPNSWTMPGWRITRPTLPNSPIRFRSAPRGLPMPGIPDSALDFEEMDFTRTGNRLRPVRTWPMKKPSTPCTTNST